MNTSTSLIALFALSGCVREAPSVDPSPANASSTRCALPAPCASPEGDFTVDCARFTDHFTECGFHLGPSLCGALASSPTPSSQRALDCYAHAPCITTRDPCAPDAPAPAIGTRMNALCGAGSYSDDLAALIAYEDRGARPDRMAALRVCETAGGCDAMQACVRAWVDAVER